MLFEKLLYLQIFRKIHEFTCINNGINLSAKNNSYIKYDMFPQFLKNQIDQILNVIQDICSDYFPKIYYFC